jgi:hypothetical protein
LTNLPQQFLSLAIPFSGRIQGSEPPMPTNDSLILVQLTADSSIKIERAFLHHSKCVESLTRLLSGREQENLTRLCQKLRRQD